MQVENIYSLMIINNYQVVINIPKTAIQTKSNYHFYI